jgi:oligoribonuclease
MKYISLDIETTGLNPKTCNVLEVGAILEDTHNALPLEKCPTFHAYIWRELYNGEAYAIAMNAPIFKKIVELKKNNNPLLMTESEFVTNFISFLKENGMEKCLLAGKNVMGFDVPFLKEIPTWNNVKVHHRHLDPTISFIDWSEDLVPPDLTTCKKRAGLPELVTHEALDDAWDVISLLRYIQNEKIGN